MKKNKNLCFLISLIVGVTTIAAAVASLVVVFTKKRKEERELEHYLDCSIQ